jgi:hypothetical protein
MSNKKITDLTELVSPTIDDVFPVVDIATNTTQKAQLGNLPVQTAVTTALATKQATLVSGTNIKTLNSVSLLGSGDIVLAATPSGVAGAIQFSDGSAFASDAANFFWDDTNNRLGVGTNTPSSTVDINSNILYNAMFSVGPSFATGFQIFNTNSTGTPVYGIGLNPSYINTRIGFYDTLTFRANGTQIAEMTSSEVRIGSISGATVGIKGSGSTSATTSLLVQNSAGASRFSVKDDGQIDMGGANATITIYQTDGNYYNANTGHYFLQGNNFQARLSGTTNPALSIGNGATAAHASSILDLTSTNRGFLPPRMTTTEKNAIASPATGLVVYDSTTNKLCCYNGSTWNDLF